MKRGLTPTQAGELWRAASALPPASREAFYAAVDARLCSLPHRFTDGDVQSAIVTVLGDASITTTSHCFMCDAAPTKEASMAQHDDDDDAFDERGLLRDGKRMRVSLMMKDGMSDTQRAIAQDASARLFDERRPGTIVSADARRKRKGTTYDPFGRVTSEEQWEEEDAASVLPPTMDAAEGRRRKQASYDAMVRKTCSAWRDPSPLFGAADAVLPSPSPRRDASPLGPTYDVEEGRARKRAALDQATADACSAWRNLLP